MKRLVGIKDRRRSYLVNGFHDTVLVKRILHTTFIPYNPIVCVIDNFWTINFDKQGNQHATCLMFQIIITEYETKKNCITKICFSGFYRSVVFCQDILFY